MDEFSIEYEFEELRPVDERGRPIFGDGVMFDGVAELELCGDGEFYVRRIRLGEEWIYPSRDGSSERAWLYRSISKALYASKGAAAAWSDALHSEGAVSFPVYDSTMNHIDQGLSGRAA